MRAPLCTPRILIAVRHGATLQHLQATPRALALVMVFHLALFESLLSFIEVFCAKARTSLSIS